MKKKRNGLVQINFDFDPILLKKFDDAAAMDSRKRSAQIRSLMMKYIKEKENR